MPKVDAGWLHRAAPRDAAAAHVAGARLPDLLRPAWQDATSPSPTRHPRHQTWPMTASPPSREICAAVDPHGVYGLRLCVACPVSGREGLLGGGRGGRRDVEGLVGLVGVALS